MSGNGQYGRSNAEGHDPEATTTIAELRAEIDQAERAALKRVEPGATAVTIAVGVMLLLVAAVLPWADGYAGWQVALGAGDMSFPRIFAVVALAVVVPASMLTLLVRRWVMVWGCAVICGLGVIESMWALWSLQSVWNTPGIGLVLAAPAMVLLALSWIRLAWSRR